MLDPLTPPLRCPCMRTRGTEESTRESQCHELSLCNLPALSRGEAELCPRGLPGATNAMPNLAVSPCMLGMPALNIYPGSQLYACPPPLPLCFPLCFPPAPPLRWHSHGMQ